MVPANDDADLLIAQTAIANAQDIPVNVICEDTNVMLTSALF